MNEFICITTNSELPYGCTFSAIPRFPYYAGALVLFLIGGICYIIGRWFPSVDGIGFIIQPNQRIRLTGQVEVEILGEIEPTPEDRSLLN